MLVMGTEANRLLEEAHKAIPSYSIKPLCAAATWISDDGKRHWTYPVIDTIPEFNAWRVYPVIIAKAYGYCDVGGSAQK